MIFKRDLIMQAHLTGAGWRPIACEWGYVVLRPLFQSFGEFFLEEMPNPYSIVVLLLNFVILNIVLMNLLIAMMASTYSKVSKQANRELIGFIHELTEEHTRRAIAGASI